MDQRILDELKAMPEKVGFYYRNLVTGETCGFNEKEIFLAASVVKLPLMASILLLRSEGKADFRELVTVRDEQKRGGCGAVQHITGDVTLDVESLCKLMITISDSTATNALFRHYGRELIKDTFLRLGMVGTSFNREYWDREAEARGIQNLFVPEEVGLLLEKIYCHTLIDDESSAWLENILLQQQINHKMGGHLPSDYPIAHKTGEETGRSNDVGIIYAKRPFVVCFASNFAEDKYVPAFEDFIRRTCRLLADENDAACAAS